MEANTAWERERNKREKETEYSTGGMARSKEEQAVFCGRADILAPCGEPVPAHGYL